MFMACLNDEHIIKDKGIQVHLWHSYCKYGAAGGYKTKTAFWKHPPV